MPGPDLIAVYRSAERDAKRIDADLTCTLSPAGLMLELARTSKAGKRVTLTRQISFETSTTVSALLAVAKAIVDFGGMI